MGLFARYLTLWVFLSIAAGIGLGTLFPSLFHALGEMEIAHINLPVALLIWMMILPMLLKIDYAALHEVWHHRRGIAVTLSINWLVKPFSMALLGWFFLQYVFAPWLEAEKIPEYIAGLILLAAAPCTAMVFVWSRLTGGHPQFTLSQVALNDMIMIFAFAPIVGLLLGVTSIIVPWDTLFLSVLLYIIIPVALAYMGRKILLSLGKLENVLHIMDPISMAALLVTVVLLFGFQGKQILAQPLVILLLAIPITIQVYFNSMLAYWLNRKLGVAHCVAGPSALIGASNFFELAVAAAIALFGFESGAALATVVGVLVEVPVMLSVVAIVNRSKNWYERGL
ncbi:MAG: arsenical-resistance protein [Zetaproteobacteria bacterium CG_4_9_14_3_um_filter_49_83]|nr:MAG: arsenical-resistance protein [Zetaproteobacteria bacterium CG1_02_49_23]PIQ31150.1 MAG: arsenical-resistance protein [Zetaproteobacteria bacterium CG17_big_fil_post_rev_8_21_14_2_50_50_13]PIY54842.1 MAG: arsenical-resistance protein [Zetaproteobacteria bacterium CG_4_10_14_0_8_um_filter_49_80]PJA35811.1 MAG: arsenical-resistance protein [Zetaproteobacteria bacterium CG_4_9_14_3_um_filter_49_83]